MAAYYNEIDEDKIEWLKELMRRGVIAPGEIDGRSIKSKVQVLRVSNSYDQVSDDRLGKEPKSFQATLDFLMIFFLPTCDAGAYEQSQLRETLRRTGMNAVLKDLIGKSERCCYRESASHAFEHDISLPLGVVSHEIREPISHFVFFGIRQSRSTYLPVRVLGQYVFRTYGNHAQRPYFRLGVSFGSGTYIYRSKIFCETVKTEEVQGHIQYSFS